MVSPLDVLILGPSASVSDLVVEVNRLIQNPLFMPRELWEDLRVTADPFTGKPWFVRIQVVYRGTEDSLPLPGKFALLGAVGHAAVRCRFDVLTLAHGTPILVDALLRVRA